MATRLKTIVLIQDERQRKEYRHLLGRVGFARIEQEIVLDGNLITQEDLDEIGGAQPDVILLDMADQPERGHQLLEQVHGHFPSTPMLVVGCPTDPAFMIQSMKLGVKDYLQKPLLQEELFEALHQLHQKLYGDPQEKTQGWILTFISSKGGTGATTISTNFAVCLSKVPGRRVLILDLDVQMGDVADCFGVKENRYLYQQEPDASTWETNHIDRTILRHPSTGVDILSLSRSFSRKFRPFPHELKRMLLSLKGEYDFVLVDTANTLDSNTIAALDLSDSIFLLSKGDLPALRNTQQFLHVFERLGYNPDRIRILLNRYSKNDGIDLSQIERTLGTRVFWAIPNNFKSVISSVHLGVPLTATTRELPLAKSLYDLSAVILGTPVEQQSKASSAGQLAVAEERAPKSTSLITLNLSNS